METLTEKRIRELLSELLDEAYRAGYARDYFYLNKQVDEVMPQFWKLLTYHAGRGDAAQEYVDAFLTGDRDWKEFRWNEVWDRMLGAGEFPTENSYEMVCAGCAKSFVGHKRGPRYCTSCSVDGLLCSPAGGGLDG